jgi:hypothetical protein
LDVFEERKICCIAHGDEEKLIFSYSPYDEVFSRSGRPVCSIARSSKCSSD